MATIDLGFFSTILLPDILIYYPSRAWTHPGNFTKQHKILSDHIFGLCYHADLVKAQLAKLFTFSTSSFCIYKMGNKYTHLKESV